MICPACNANTDKVIDSRPSEAGQVIRRRRECLVCGKRFTTYERVERSARLTVVKRDGTRVPFNRDNVLRGIQAACGKRNIPVDVRQRIAEEVEEELVRDFDREVASTEIGRRVMSRLREIDDVAYIRFACEYLQLGTAKEIMIELEDLEKRPRDAKAQGHLFSGA